MSETSTDGMERIAGSTEVEIECPTNEAERELCGGCSDTIELDEPAYIENEYIHLPGFEWECPECGNPHEFVVDGIRVSDLV
jgi:hypothetical protein